MTVLQLKAVVLPSQQWPCTLLLSLVITGASVLHQLTRSTKLNHGQGTKVLFVATIDRLPHHPAQKVGEPQTAVLPLLGLISVAQ